MSGKVLTRRIAPVITACAALALAACATAPPREQSILDAIDAQGFNLGPQSCAALDAAAICTKSTRLDKGRKCGCADRNSIADGRPIRF